MNLSHPLSPIIRLGSPVLAKLLPADYWPPERLERLWVKLLDLMGNRQHIPAGGTQLLKGRDADGELFIFLESLLAYPVPPLAATLQLEGNAVHKFRADLVEAKALLTEYLARIAITGEGRPRVLATLNPTG